jgi:hypothetical protein
MTSVTDSRNALTGRVFLSVFCGKKGAATILHITVDFATAASQNGFSTSLHMKTNIIQKMTKGTLDFLITVIFYQGAVVKQDHYMTLWLSCANIHRFVMQPLQNPPLCSSTQKRSILFQLHISF